MGTTTQPSSRQEPPAEVSNKTFEDFLLATNPCMLNLPAELLAKVREGLQARLAKGELTEEELTEFARRADVERMLRSSSSD